MQTDRPATGGNGGPVGLIAAVVIAVLLLALVGFVMLQVRQNSGERQVLPAPPAQAPAQTAPPSPSTKKIAPRNPLDWVEPRTVVESWRAWIGRGGGDLAPNSTFTILTDGFEIAGGGGDERWQFWKVSQYHNAQNSSGFVFEVTLDPQLSGAEMVRVHGFNRESDMFDTFRRAYEGWQSSPRGRDQLAAVNRSGVRLPSSAAPEASGGSRSGEPTTPRPSVSTPKPAAAAPPLLIEGTVPWNTNLPKTTAALTANADGELTVSFEGSRDFAFSATLQWDGQVYRGSISRPNCQEAVPFVLQHVNGALIGSLEQHDCGKSGGRKVGVVLTSRH